MQVLPLYKLSAHASSVIQSAGGVAISATGAANEQLTRPLKDKLRMLVCLLVLVLALASVEVRMMYAYMSIWYMYVLANRILLMHWLWFHRWSHTAFC
jgi:membrane-associated HD superfamily phosphohydrolase